LYTIGKDIGCNIFIIAPTLFCKYSLKSSQNPQYNCYRVSVCTHSRRHTQAVETNYWNKKPSQDLALKRQKEVKSKDHSINCPYMYQNSQMACVCMWYHAVFEQDRVSSFNTSVFYNQNKYGISYCLNVNRPYLSRVDYHWKIRARKQRTDIGKYSFVNRYITDWNQLPERAIETSHGKTHIFKTRVRKV
jgi:hypothetical protein